jgi:hypothetical protein
VFLAGAAMLVVASCAKNGGSPSTIPATQAATQQTSGPDETLAKAVEEWVGLLESNDLSQACNKWARDDEAMQQMTRWWDTLRKCHQQYDYRNWIAKAKHVSGTSFKVGGHEYGFMHIDWEETPQGWRIVRIWICR